MLEGECIALWNRYKDTIFIDALRVLFIVSGGGAKYFLFQRRGFAKHN